MTDEERELIDACGDIREDLWHDITGAMNQRDAEYCGSVGERLKGLADIERVDRVVVALRAWLKAVTILLLCLVPHVASAQSPAPYAVVIAGNVADIWTTQRAFDRGLVEGNPLLGQHPKFSTLVATKVATTAVTILAMRTLASHGHPTLAKVLGYTLGGVTLAVAGHNERAGR